LRRFVSRRKCHGQKLRLIPHLRKNHK